MKTRVAALMSLIILLSMTRMFAHADREKPLNSPDDNLSVYFPLITRQPVVDLVITRLEISQAIQTPGHTVPFVTDRPTLVRAYLQATGTEPVEGVFVSFSASRGGVPLPDSPLIIGPRTAPIEPSQGTYVSTINVPLPDTWLSGTISLTVTADPAGVIPETNEENNVQLTALSFHDVPPLNLKIVPINYTERPTGIYFPAVFTDPVSGFLMGTFPLSSINVTFRTPVNFTGDLSAGSEWNRLLNYITSIKNSDGAPRSQVYYGLVPVTNGNGDYIETAWGGMAWYGSRIAVGIDESFAYDYGTIGAHEIGHTFGRRHAPCGDPSDVDPNYPYPNASIGNYGIDVLNDILISPGDPDRAKDLMSYCYPLWISDYTYVALYNDQRARGVLAPQIATQPVMLIRVVFNNIGIASFLPVYSLMGIPDEKEPTSDYFIELLDATGTTLATYPVKQYEAGERGESYFAIHTIIPQPVKPISEVRLTYKGEIITTRSLKDQESIQATVRLLDPLTKELTLQWDDGDVPTLVRYSAGNDELWTTLDLDIQGGSIQIDSSLISADTMRFEIIPADSSSPIRKLLFFVNKVENK